MSADVMTSTVYIRQTSPATLPGDARRMLAKVNFSAWNLTAPTYVKINGNYDRRYPGSNTSPWFLDALLSALCEWGFECLTVVEGDLPYFTADQMICRTGLIQALERHAVHFVNYEHLERDVLELPRILDGAQVINVPVLHSHGIAVMSCATKNLFGLLPTIRRKYHLALSEKLLDLYEKVKCFTIVDGTVGLVGESTRRGIPQRLDLILAGWDTLAIDSVVAKIMGFSSYEIPFLKLAMERGMLDPEEVKIEGEFNWETLPSYNFKFNMSTTRKIVMRLESSFLESWPLFRWLETRLEKIYHNYSYVRTKEQLFNGPWMEYEKEYINQIS